LQVARSPDTPAAQLRSLADHSNAAVREAVAAHPNVPADVLVELAADFPEAFLGNPAAELLALEDPALSQQVPVEAVERALATDEVPSKWLAWCCRRPEERLRLCVAAHPSTSGALLHRLLEDSASGVRARLAERPTLSAELLGRLAEDPSEDVRYMAAAHPETPSRALVHLARDPSADVRWQVARHARVPAHVVERLAGDPDVLVRVGLATRSTLPSATLEHLSTDEVSWVRKCAAGHPEAPASLLERLTEDQSTPVRERARLALTERRSS